MSWNKFVVENTLKLNKAVLCGLLKISDDIQFDLWDKKNWLGFFLLLKLRLKYIETI